VAGSPPTELAVVGAVMARASAQLEARLQADRRRA
jgi:hypothetical protein